MDTMSAADIAAVTRNNSCGYGDGCGMGMGGGWLAWILIFALLGGNGFGWGNRGNGQPVTEAGLCNAMNFNNLENAVGRGFDQQSQFAFQNQRDLCTSTATLSNQMTNGFYGVQGQLAECLKKIFRKVKEIFNYKTNFAVGTCAA